MRSPVFEGEPVGERGAPVWRPSARNSPGNVRFLPITRQLCGGCRSPFRVLFTKDLKGCASHADKGCVSTLAHTMMTAARSADSGPGELDRYPYTEAPAGERAALRSWGGSDSELGRASRRGTASRGRGLHGQLVQQLGQMIVSGDLGADRPLVPEEIGQRFEVSRTVVRESLRVLEAKGLVSARPNVGTRGPAGQRLEPPGPRHHRMAGLRSPARRPAPRAGSAPLDDRAAGRPAGRRSWA